MKEGQEEGGETDGKSPKDTVGEEGRDGDLSLQTVRKREE